MSYRDMKRGLSLLIKGSVRPNYSELHHLMLLRKYKITNVGEREKRDTHALLGGCANGCSHCEEQYRGSSKSQNYQVI